ncbi:MAG TPA: GNAT family N-acetyltransferase [Mycobacteriales bacterium]|nr:GNAT family N-acetyltransferase [Mycobacteriales bacterium]HVX69370.1 GNAT family N-acetyltransferase [Mycobacteriales bacterium]
MSEITVRPMTPDDVDDTVRVQLAAFAAAGETITLTQAQLARTKSRHRYFIDHDQGGAWAATVDAEIVGCGLALKREGLWGLSLLVVDPATQSQGVGRQLLDATLRYAEGCERAIIQSSSDSRAIRAYATSGFDLFPQMLATGTPVVDAAPGSVNRVRVAGPADFAFADEVDRAVRGAARGADHGFIEPGTDMYAVDDADGRGYVYRRDSDIYLLAATDDDTAAALLWRCFQRLAELDVEAAVDHLTAEQQWAIDACITARLKMAPGGPVFWRGATPPRSYLPSGAFL